MYVFGLFGEIVNGHLCACQLKFSSVTAKRTRTQIISTSLYCTTISHYPSLYIMEIGFCILDKNMINAQSLGKLKQVKTTSGLKKTT